MSLSVVVGKFDGRIGLHEAWPSGHPIPRIGETYYSLGTNALMRVKDVVWWSLEGETQCVVVIEQGSVTDRELIKSGWHKTPCHECMEAA